MDRKLGFVHGADGITFMPADGCNRASLEHVETVIRKVVLRKDLGLRLEIEEVFAEVDEAPRVVHHVIDSPIPVHDDLMNVLGRFVPHFLILGEEGDYESNIRSKDLQKMMQTGSMDVSGPHIAKDWRIKNIQYHGQPESHEASGLMMYGQKSLRRSGKPVGHLLPLVKFGDDYQFMVQLNDAWDDLVTETMLYLNGKHRPGQLALGFDGEHEEPQEAVDAALAQDRKKSKKKAA